MCQELHPNVTLTDGVLCADNSDQDYGPCLVGNNNGANTVPCVTLYNNQHPVSAPLTGMLTRNIFIDIKGCLFFVKQNIGYYVAEQSPVDTHDK